MKIKLSWLFAILLSGCGDGSQIKDAVTERLRDPDSAKFGELVVSEAGDRACIEYNAKNGYGGYGQASIAELWKFDGAWRVTEMEGSHHNCTEIEFQADVAGLQASGEASGNALDQLSVLGKFSSDEEKFAASRGEGACGKLINEVGMYARDLAAARIRKSGDVKTAESDFAYVIAKVNAGNCDGPTLLDTKMFGANASNR